MSASSRASSRRWASTSCEGSSLSRMRLPKASSRMRVTRSRSPPSARLAPGKARSSSSVVTSPSAQAKPRRAPSPAGGSGARRPGARRGKRPVGEGLPPGMHGAWRPSVTERRPREPRIPAIPRRIADSDGQWGYPSQVWHPPAAGAKFGCRPSGAADPTCAGDRDGLHEGTRREGPQLRPAHHQDQRGARRPRDRPGAQGALDGRGLRGRTCRPSRPRPATRSSGSETQGKDYVFFLRKVSAPPPAPSRNTP